MVQARAQKTGLITWAPRFVGLQPTVIASQLARPASEQMATRDHSKNRGRARRRPSSSGWSNSSYPGSIDFDVTIREKLCSSATYMLLCSGGPERRRPGRTSSRAPRHVDSDKRALSEPRARHMFDLPL